MNLPTLTTDALNTVNAVTVHMGAFSRCFRHCTKKPTSLIAVTLLNLLQKGGSGPVYAVHQSLVVDTGYSLFDKQTDGILDGDANDSTYIARRIHARNAKGGDSVRQKADLVSFGATEFGSFGQWVINTIQELPEAQDAPHQAYVFFTRTGGIKKPFGALITDSRRNVVAQFGGPTIQKQTAVEKLALLLSNKGDQHQHWAGEVVNGEVYVALPEIAELLAERNVKAIVSRPLA